MSEDGREKIFVWLLKRLKPTICGFTGNAWADSKSDVIIESTVVKSPYKKGLTGTLYVILEVIAFFRFIPVFRAFPVIGNDRDLAQATI